MDQIKPKREMKQQKEQDDKKEKGKALQAEEMIVKKRAMVPKMRRNSLTCGKTMIPCMSMTQSGHYHRVKCICRQVTNTFGPERQNIRMHKSRKSRPGEPRNRRSYWSRKPR